MTKYTFELDNNVPNDWLVVTAKNKKEAKRLLMKRMDQVNRKCMRVIIFDQKRLEAEESYQTHESKPTKNLILHNVFFFCDTRHKKVY